MTKKTKRPQPYKESSPKDSEEIQQNESRKPTFVSWAVFLPTLAVTLISLVSVVFPALIMRTTSRFQDIMVGQQINPFEFGALAAPLLVTNIIVFGLAILYFRNKLPRSLADSLKKIFDVELSKKTALVTLLVLLVIYIAGSAGELASEESWADYINVKKRAESWDFSQINSFDVHVRYFLLSSSLNLFNNIRIIPFIASISLLVLTYFITKEISEKRFAGIVAVVIMLQSSVFLSYDTTATYDNFWILFYLLSLYLLYKKWHLSALSYIISIPSKTLTAAYLPLTVFFIYRSKLKRKEKLLAVISYAILVAILVAAVFILKINLTYGTVESNIEEFWRGFASMAFQLRFDGLAVVFLLPLVVGLFVASRKGIIQADSIMVLLMGILLSAPLLLALTNQTNQPYRFVPLVAFFAIGVGTLLSRRSSQQT